MSKNNPHRGVVLGTKRHRPTDSPFRSTLNPFLSSLLAALLFAAASSTSQATIINGASSSLADVKVAINSAADGDTVVIPAGTAAWTSTLVVLRGSQ